MSDYYANKEEGEEDRGADPSICCVRRCLVEIRLVYLPETVSLDTYHVYTAVFGRARSDKPFLSSMSARSLLQMAFVLVQGRPCSIVVGREAPVTITAVTQRSSGVLFYAKRVFALGSI